MAVKPIPDGQRTVTPYLIVKGAAQLITFLKEAFGATEACICHRSDGTIMHADVVVGDSHIMLGEGCDQFPPMPGSIHLYVTDADAVYRAAIQAGATSVMEPTTHFYGDRSGGVRDASGNCWWISTHVEDVSLEEMDRRRAEWEKSRAA